MTTMCIDVLRKSGAEAGRNTIGSLTEATCGGCQSDLNDWKRARGECPESQVGD